MDRTIEGWLLLADPAGRAHAVEGVSAPTGPRSGAKSAPPRTMVDGLLGLANADRNHLGQGWGVVVPRGERRRLDWIRALVLHRATDPAMAAFVAHWARLRARGDARSQGPTEPVPVFEAGPEQFEPAEAITWVQAHFRDLRGPDEAARPGHLLFLGDLHELPLTLQQVLDGECMVGRLAFTRADGSQEPHAFAAYAAKVVAHETGPERVGAPPAHVYIASDGSPAVQIAQAGIIEPSLAHLAASGRFTSPRRLEDAWAPDPTSLLDATELRRPGLLVSLSHGQGAWGDGPVHQRRHQGALWFGAEAPPLTADMLSEHLAVQPFLPGGVWFLLACFGLGTPTRSAYAPWLARAAPEGLARVEQGLAAERPFVAALPQAALADPRGPLAIVGHVDLAWTWGMRRLGPHTKEVDALPAAARFSRFLQALGLGPPASAAAPLTTGVWGAQGGPQRVGAAFSLLVDARREVERDLATLHAGMAVPGASWPELWLARQDLAGYALLGDPATHLPIRRGPEVEAGAPLAALQALVRAEALGGRDVVAELRSAGRKGLIGAGVLETTEAEAALLADPRAPHAQAYWDAAAAAWRALIHTDDSG